MNSGGKVRDGLVNAYEPAVKVEPNEDVKDIKADIENFCDGLINSSSTLWSFLVKTVRCNYRKEYGQKMNNTKMTRLLLAEFEQLLDDVAVFIRSCCNATLDPDDGNDSNDREDVIEVNDRLAQVVVNPKATRFLVNVAEVIPFMYKNSLFGPLKDKEMDIMDVQQSVDARVFQDVIEDEGDDNIVPFVELGDEQDDAKPSNSHNVASMGYPEPKLVPGKEGGKIKTFYKCEKCNKSFPKRKRYYNHKLNGKCTMEPKWIRWHKNHKRVECAHPDCSHKINVDYTYPGLMKHIIEAHTVQEDSTVQCPDCPLKFPLKAALKYHQEMAHQAHAKICTVCGKVVRDMRKHRLIHSGEKPFQCDRCSYRCARSSSLKRHLATHLNSSAPAAAPQQTTEMNNSSLPKFVPQSVVVQQPSMQQNLTHQQQILITQPQQLIQQQQQQQSHEQIAFTLPSPLQATYRAMKFP